jgi:hypothetical protein
MCIFTHGITLDPEVFEEFVDLHSMQDQINDYHISFRHYSVVFRSII